VPGQTDLIESIPGFRAAVPAGFEITGLRNFEGETEIVTICSWKSTAVKASQLAALFRFRGEKIFEERWFVDTEQWKGAS